MNIITYLRTILRLKYAIDRADEAHQKTGDRYYVLPGPNDKLIILNRRQFRSLKKQGRISHRARILDLQKECFYCTPYQNGVGALSPHIRQLKRKMYLEYTDYQLRSR